MGATNSTQQAAQGVAAAAATTATQAPLPRVKIVKYTVIGNCVLLVVGGFISFLMNILSFLDPTLPVLSIYICLFGLVAIAGEMNLSIATKYFGFFQDWLGEALFFIFVGTLGISFGTNGILALIIGIVSCICGILCILDHFAFSRKLIQNQQGQ